MGTLDREPLRPRVESWFAPASLEQLLDPPAAQTGSASPVAKAADEPLGAESAA
jgi:hypothetical protein